MWCRVKSKNCLYFSFILSHRSVATQSYCNVEINDSFVQIIGHVGRLHSHVGDINGAGEQEENSQARQQQAKGHWYRDIELSGGEKKQKWDAETSFWLQSLLCYCWVSSCRRLTRFISTKSSQSRLTSCLAWAFGRCMEWEPQAGSLGLLNNGEKRGNSVILLLDWVRRVS